jgi:uncharacterized membrane protein
MSDLVVIAYPDEVKAQEVRVALARLQKEYLIDLEDAVVVTKDGEGKIKLHQSVNLTAAGAVGGGFWGGLVGLLFLMPFAGAAVGAGLGALSGKFSDIGIDDKFVKDLSENLAPNSSALFILIRKVTEDKVVPEIAKYGGVVLRTSLSHEAEARLRTAFVEGSRPA